MKSSRSILFTTAAIALSMSLALMQQGRTSAQSATMKLSSMDKTFMTKAAQGGLAEVELGQLATQHGSSEAVKQFGQHMVDDHSKANTELMDVASQKHVALPKSPAKKDVALKTHLSKLSAANFDKQYMSDMVKDHQEDIALFQKEADNGKDPDIKAFAAKTLPTLKKHLMMAESVRDGKGMPAE